MLELSAAPFRYHELLYEHWNKLRGARVSAPISGLDGESLGAVWGTCFVVDYGDGSLNPPLFIYKGTELEAAAKADPEVASYFFSNEARAFKAQLRQVAQLSKPVVEQAELIASDKRIVRYRCCLLSFDDGADTITHIVGCLRWRVFDAQEAAATPHDFGWEGPGVR
jgi:hypothetical protein